MAELNRFLGGHRVIGVEKHLVTEPEQQPGLPPGPSTPPEARDAARGCPGVRPVPGGDSLANRNRPSRCW